MIIVSVYTCAISPNNQKCICQVQLRISCYLYPFHKESTWFSIIVNQKDVDDTIIAIIMI